MSQQKTSGADARPLVILVVDACRAVLKMLGTALSKYGFEVLAADNGRDACVLYGIERDRIDVVLLDTNLSEPWTAPWVGGALRAIDASARIAYMSAGLRPDQLDEWRVGDVGRIFHKPFLSTRALADELRALAREC